MNDQTSGVQGRWAAPIEGMEAYLSKPSEAGEALVLRSSVPILSVADGIIFDVDGVLIDVSESIRLVHGASARLYFESLGWSNCEYLVRPEDVDEFKLAGGFNSDWELAYSWLLFYLYKGMRHASTDGSVLVGAAPSLREFASGLARQGGGLDSAARAIRESCTSDEWAELNAHWDREGVQRIFVEVYSGDLCPEIYGFEPRLVKGSGLIQKDRPILERQLLPAAVKLGIATGRTSGETRVGLRLNGWTDLFEENAVITEDDRFKKPDPRILHLAVERLGAERSVYVGDTPDDLVTVQRYNSDYGGAMLSCMVLTGVGGKRAREWFIERQADVVADNVNAALAAISRLRGGVA